MKIKTSDLTHATLDWAVSAANEDSDIYPYSTSWQEGGPIIEREKITLEWTGENWCAYIRHDEEVFGPTALIAAMRCYVASRLGDEVEVPDELL